jgi:alpha-1,6-mannosyltransferase
MRIVDLCEFYSERGGGVRSYLDRLSRASAGTGHEVFVVAPGPADSREQVGGGTVIRFRSPKMPYDPTYHAPLRVDRMRALVRELKPDVLQVSSPFAPAWVAATLVDVPYKSYVYHSDPIGCYVTGASRSLRLPFAGRALEGASWGYLRRVCSAFDATIVAGHWLERELVSHGFRNVETIPFGIDRSDLGPENRDEALRAKLLGRLQAEPGAKLVLVGGRLAKDKRQGMLLEALIRASRDLPLALLLLGDGPEKPRLLEAAKGLRAVTDVAFTKDRQEYATLLSSVDLLLHGSMCETFGFFLGEALASGTPLVVPDRGGAAELGSPACVERYPAFGGPEAVVRALRRMLERPAAQTRSAAAAAAQSIPDLSEHFRQLFAFYEARLGMARRS